MLVKSVRRDPQGKIVAVEERQVPSFVDGLGHEHAIDDVQFFVQIEDKRVGPIDLKSAQDVVGHLHWAGVASQVIFLEKQQ